jgi:hypothetical protein
MSTKDTGGPAFPIPDTQLPNGEWVWGAGGMTLRDYFAMQAPKDPPHWFEPKMREKPEPKLVDANGNEYANRYQAKQAVGEDGWWDANAGASEEWEKDYLISTMAQWPWFWADIQLEARKQ